MKKGWATVAITLLVISAIIWTALICISSSTAKAKVPSSRNVPQEDTVKCINKLIDNFTFTSIPSIDSRVKSYMARWEIKGAALAITRNDTLVYAKGYGKADEAVGMQPFKIMRMASVSKLVTAAAIMKLQDEGKLSIKDTVFGAHGILSAPVYTKAIGHKVGYDAITVEMLLRHQGGFRRDPMFGIYELMKETGSKTPLTHDQTVKLGLGSTLRFAPGTWQKYSNFGYFLLTDVVEAASGMPYEQYVNEHVMAPAGCHDFHIGGIWYSDKRPNEVRYYTQNGDGKYIPDYRDTTKKTERSYGGNDIRLLAGAGGWTASVTELARFVASIDGDPAVPDILSKESVAAMTEYIDDATYSLGWNDTNPATGWTRTGTLSGTSALIHKYPDGECWILLTNTSTYKGPAQTKLTEALFVQLRSLGIIPQLPGLCSWYPEQ